MSGPSGFSFAVRKNGDVAISHHGRPASVLRGARAVDFLDEVDGLEVDDPLAQERMARLTGNYKRGNEREARNHPRNRGRRR